MCHYYFRQDVHPDIKRKVGDLDRKFHRIRPEANIWAMGAVMWNLVTLKEIEVLDDKVHKILFGENAVARAFDGRNIVKRADPEVKRRYSPKLWELICECLQMRPGDRPPPSRLLSEIEIGMQECMEREQEAYGQTGDLMPIKVAFEENQINTLPDGGAHFHKHINFWPDFADHLLWTPREWGPLCPPEAPRRVNFEADGLPSPLRRRQEQRWNEALEERDMRIAAQSAADLQLSTPPPTKPGTVQRCRRRNPYEDWEQQTQKRSRRE